MEPEEFLPEADASFDRYARIVRSALRVPIALVSIVQPARQVFPGAAGLSQPLASERQTPLTHSFCQYVVADEAPLVVSDARLVARLRDNLAIEDIGVIAYAGFPLHNADGAVIGSLCAIDSVPREWTPADLAMLADLAQACSAEIALRRSRQELALAAEQACDLSQRARVLLSLSERLAETVTHSDIAAALQDTAAKNLGCLHAGIWLLNADTGDLDFVRHPSESWARAEGHAHFTMARPSPISAPLTGRRPVFMSDRASQDAVYPELSDASAEDGEARALMPLNVAGQQLGTLVLVWAGQRRFSDEERITIAALTSYTSQAVHRAQLLAERSSVASTMQAALLTDLPHPPGLELAARYLTAAVSDEVGGDWYDAVVMPSGATNLMIGDVMGHDISAAARMGALRDMLRTLAWAIDEPPSSNMTLLDRAARDVGLRTYATLIFARVEQQPLDALGGSRLLRWTNAGHPPPILLRPDGSSTLLDDQARADCMLGVFPDRSRRDQNAELPPGSTLVLYTDGLIESRDRTLDDGIAGLTSALSRHHARPVDELLDAVLGELVGDTPSDDVAVLAVRVATADAHA